MSESPHLIVMGVVGDDRLLDEAGGHRVQRVPRNERRGRVHTSTVTVAVVTNTSNTGGPRDHPSEHFKVEWFSGTGKGGQHRNKHQNCARVTHAPTGIRREGKSSRSRETNLKEATSAIEEELRRMAQDDENGRQNAVRVSQVGSGMRGDKRRTYRFQDDSVVDHVTGRKARTGDVMRGRIDILWR